MKPGNLPGALPGALAIYVINCHAEASILWENRHVYECISTPQLEARVRQRVESGMYGSASEVIREALRLFEAYDLVKTAKLDSLRQDITAGLNDAKSGRAKEIDFASLKQQGRQLLKTRNAA